MNGANKPSSSKIKKNTRKTIKTAPKKENKSGDKPHANIPKGKKGKRKRRVLTSAIKKKKISPKKKENLPKAANQPPVPKKETGLGDERPCICCSNKVLNDIQELRAAKKDLETATAAPDTNVPNKGKKSKKDKGGTSVVESEPLRKSKSKRKWKTRITIPLVYADNDQDPVIALPELLPPNATTPSKKVFVPSSDCPFENTTSSNTAIASLPKPYSHAVSPQKSKEECGVKFEEPVPVESRDMEWAIIQPPSKAKKKSKTSTASTSAIKTADEQSARNTNDTSPHESDDQHPLLQNLPIVTNLYLDFFDLKLLCFHYGHLFPPVPLLPCCQETATIACHKCTHFINQFRVVLAELNIPDSVRGGVTWPTSSDIIVNQEYISKVKQIISCILSMSGHVGKKRDYGGIEHWEWTRDIQVSVINYLRQQEKNNHIGEHESFLPILLLAEIENIRIIDLMISNLFYKYNIRRNLATNAFENNRIIISLPENNNAWEAQNLNLLANPSQYVNTGMQNLLFTPDQQNSQKPDNCNSNSLHHHQYNPPINYMGSLQDFNSQNWNIHIASQDVGHNPQNSDNLHSIPFNPPPQNTHIASQNVGHNPQNSDNLHSIPFNPPPQNTHIASQNVGHNPQNSDNLHSIPFNPPAQNTHIASQNVGHNPQNSDNLHSIPFNPPPGYMQSLHDFNSQNQNTHIASQNVGHPQNSDNLHSIPFNPPPNYMQSLHDFDSQNQNTHIASQNVGHPQNSDNLHSIPFNPPPNYMQSLHDFNSQNRNSYFTSPNNFGHSPQNSENLLSNPSQNYMQSLHDFNSQNPNSYFTSQNNFGYNPQNSENVDSLENNRPSNSSQINQNLNDGLASSQTHSYHNNSDPPHVDDSYIHRFNTLTIRDWPDYNDPNNVDMVRKAATENYVLSQSQSTNPYNTYVEAGNNYSMSQPAMNSQQNFYQSYNPHYNWNSRFVSRRFQRQRVSRRLVRGAKKKRNPHTNGAIDSRNYNNNSNVLPEASTSRQDTTPSNTNLRENNNKARPSTRNNHNSPPVLGEIETPSNFGANKKQGPPTTRNHHNSDSALGETEGSSASNSRQERDSGQIEISSCSILGAKKKKGRLGANNNRKSTQPSTSGTATPSCSSSGAKKKDGRAPRNNSNSTEEDENGTPHYTIFGANKKKEDKK